LPRQRFRLSLLNVAMMICALGLPAFFPHPIYSLAYGVVIGGFCQLLWQVPVLVRLRIPLVPR
jgi:putative peptidoglycan lipid II flippase